MLSFGSVIVCWFIRKDAKAEVKMRFWKQMLKPCQRTPKGLPSISKKQAEIASAPAPDRDDVHSWLWGIGQRDKD